MELRRFIFIDSSTQCSANDYYRCDTGIFTKFSVNIRYYYSIAAITLQIAHKRKVNIAGKFDVKSLLELCHYVQYRFR